MLLQYVDIVEPVLSSIEAITERCQQTLAALAAADDDGDDSDRYIHVLEASFLTISAVYAPQGGLVV